jgi:class 3 adenylate cyclase
VAEPGQIVLSAAVRDRIEEGDFELGSLGKKNPKKWWWRRLSALGSQKRPSNPAVPTIVEGWA